MEKSDETYKSVLTALEKDNPNIKNDEVIKKLYDRDIRSNYYILRFFIEHPLLQTSPHIIDEIGKFVYEYNPRKTYYEDVLKRIKILENIQPTFWQHEEFINFLNNINFNYLESYFKNKTMMNCPEFVDYLINKIKSNNVDFHRTTTLAEDALNDKLDLDLVYALGNGDELNNYMETHNKAYIFDIILKTKSKELKKKLLIDVLKIEDTRTIDILLKFFNYEEVRIQLLDETSFYYKFLIEPILRDRSLDEMFDCEEYGSLNSIGWFESEDFEKLNFNKMIHHFDKFMNNYIYFYDNKRVKRVPVLSFIKTMKEKIERLKLYESDSPDFFEPFTYFEITIEALEENTKKRLKKKDEEYWTYLLNVTKQYYEKICLGEKYCSISAIHDDENLYSNSIDENIYKNLDDDHYYQYLLKKSNSQK